MLTGDDYAVMFDQVLQCPEAAWYLTVDDETAAVPTRSIAIFARN
jgi:hypothetical protein